MNGIVRAQDIAVEKENTVKQQSGKPCPLRKVSWNNDGNEVDGELPSTPRTSTTPGILL